MKKSKILTKLLKENPPNAKTIFVFGISGGKDSKATLVVSIPLLLKIVKPSQIKVIFCDTGWEKIETINEIEKIKTKLNEFNIEFVRLNNSKYPNGMMDLLKDKKIFPSRQIKFCTEQLKMIPALNYYKDLYNKGLNVIALVGKRRDESKDRINTPNKEFFKHKKYSFTVYYPVADWSETDIYSFLDETWGIPISYFKGNKRIGCDECFQADLKSISLMSDEKVKAMASMEKYVSQFHKDKEYNPTFFYRKNSTFPEGFAPIEEMVTYAKKKYNFSYFTFHTRALRLMSNKIGQKALRYKFIQYGYIPNKSNFSKYINGILSVPQTMQFDVEILATKILTAKERMKLLKFEKLEKIEKEDVSPTCDCESYNLL
jgi:3'-phosphoadenosine 5'-phosphosulfate sulfotransferase (PAPS reductase)/FAD synthetase